MGSAQGGSTLDDLMLAYTDLSAPAKGHGQGFKGPPVKDIRREAPSKVFQHSNKARNWKTLDQSLESAFGAALPVKSVAAAAMAFTPQPQLFGGGGVRPTQAVQNMEFDEWGDFQDFNVPSSNNSVSLLENIQLSAPPPPPTHTSQTVGCRLASFQDESPVHRFKTVVPTPVPLPHNIPVNIPNFSAPPLALPRPLILPQANYKSQPSSILDLDDEFGDFAVPTTRSFTSLTSSNISLSSSKSFSSTFPIDQPLQPMPKHQNTFPIDRPISLSNTFPIDKPVSVNKTFNIDQPVAVAATSSTAVSFPPVGTMTISEAPPVATMPLSLAPLAPTTASTSSDKYSALRLFLDQPEEPSILANGYDDTSVDPPNIVDIDARKPSDNFNPFESTNATDSGDADFGDFVEVSAPSSVSNVEISQQFPLSDFFSQSVCPQPTIPNLLTSPQTSTNSFPSQLVSPKPNSAQPGSNKSSSNFPLQFTSPQPRNFPTLLPSPTNQNEDRNLDEWSLPSTSQLSFENEKPIQNPYKPPKPTNIPFFCSSPPPTDASVPSIMSSSPPLMSSPGCQLNVEEFSLPSEQFGFSDQEIFGIKKVKKESNQPQSIQDILSFSKKNKTLTESPKHSEEYIEDVKSVEPISASLENSRQGSPSSLRVPSKSPESQSVASLEFDNHNDPTKPYNDKKPEFESLDNKGIFSSPPLSRYNGFMTEEPKPSSSPYKEWSLLLSEILTLIESTRDTFDNIISEDLKEEVITSEQGKIFLQNLNEVHKVYMRVAKSYRQRVDREQEKEGLEAVGQFCDEIDRDWQRLKEHCENYDVLTKLENEVSDGDGVCGVCTDVGGGLVYGGAAYHPGCANYWVNCVRDTLPRLA